MTQSINFGNKSNKPLTALSSYLYILRAISSITFHILILAISIVFQIFDLYLLYVFINLLSCSCMLGKSKYHYLLQSHLLIVVIHEALLHCEVINERIIVKHLLHHGYKKLLLFKKFLRVKVQAKT